MNLSIEPLFLGEHAAIVHDYVDNKPVFEQKKTAASKLRETVLRINEEYGPRLASLTVDNVEDPEEEDNASEDGIVPAENDTPPHLNKSSEPTPFEDIVKMRNEVFERNHATQGALNSILSVTDLLIASKDPTHTIPPDLAPLALNGTPILPPHPTEIKSSIRATDLRITLGIKDAAIEDAASILSRAASGISASVDSGSLRWEQALRARRANWTLIPGQRQRLPGGSSVQKDFSISYALEDSPLVYRQRSLVALSERTSGSGGDVVFPTNFPRRIRVSLAHRTASGLVKPLASKIIDLTSTEGSEQESETPSLHTRLLQAQREIVDEETFFELMKEAATFPSASTSVSDRRISVEAAKSTNLVFELIPTSEIVYTSSEATASPLPETPDKILCTLILHVLTLLLLRTHRTRRLVASAKLSAGIGRSLSLRVDAPAFVPVPSAQRVPGSAPATTTGIPTKPILAPIVSLLQYRSFMQSLMDDLQKFSSELVRSGITSEIMFTPVGESFDEMLEMLATLDNTSAGFGSGIAGAGMGVGGGTYEGVAGGSASSKDAVGIELSGEALLWIDKKHTLRLTFSSPTTLTLHLPHATLNITSLKTLRTFLTSELRLIVLSSLKDEGELKFGGRWAMDRLDAGCVAAWDERGASMRLIVDFNEATLAMSCTAFVERVREDGATTEYEEKYLPSSERAPSEDIAGTDIEQQTLTAWFKEVGKRALKRE